MNFKDYIFILTLFTILLLAILSPTSKPEFLEVCVEVIWEDINLVDLL